MAEEMRGAAEQRLTMLEASVKNAHWQIERMQKLGGFTDAKTLSMRATRIEERLEVVEFDGEMLKDVVAYNAEAWEDHLKDRHDSDIVRDSAIDTTKWRQIRHRLRVWAEKRGLVNKRRDVAGARQGENRLRPASSSA